MTTAVGEIIRNGVLFDMKNWGDGSLNPENLPAVVDQLFTLLSERQVEYLLVDGVALLSYVEGRNTQDVDFILSKADLETMPEIALTEENRDFAQGRFQGLQIDL
jgi:hypothetical protein